MRMLTENQKEFIIGAFYHPEYVGWRNIATNLVETGKCIVAGEFQIWQGGIGNFIETKNAVGTVGCLEYTFDINEFIGSGIFEERKEAVLSAWQDTKREAEEMLQRAIGEISDIENLI